MSTIEVTHNTARFNAYTVQHAYPTRVPITQIFLVKVVTYMCGGVVGMRDYAHHVACRRETLQMHMG